MSNFSLYSKYYDLLYNDKDYAMESNYVIETLKRFSPNIKSVLELGSGSGAHAKYFCKNGFEVVGIEKSAEMVDMANKKMINGFLSYEADISNFNLNMKFDSAISLFHVINYLTDNQSVINCFRLVNNHLNSNGIFLFDIWYSPAVYAQKPQTRIKRIENDQLKVVRIGESKILNESNIVVVDFELIITDKIIDNVSVLTESHSMRHFSIPEISFFAQNSGFELVLTEEFVSKKNPSDDTWGICCVLKKIN